MTLGVTGDVTPCSKNATIYEQTGIERCPEESWLALTLFAGYMIFTNVLLLSLLIAMFRFVTLRFPFKFCFKCKQLYGK